MISVLEIVMFQSFTGSSRRPRQVNLSGRNTNPFAPTTAPTRHNPHNHGAQNTLAIAELERKARQQERERLGATRILQRAWRGYLSRKQMNNVWRTEWDSVEQSRIGKRPVSAFADGTCIGPSVTIPPYTNAAQCLSQLRLLLTFLEKRDSEDVLRLIYFAIAFQNTIQQSNATLTEGNWELILNRLAKIDLHVLQFLATANTKLQAPIEPLFILLRTLAKLIPKRIARNAKFYFEVMRDLTLNMDSLSQSHGLSMSIIIESNLALLQPITSETLIAYEWFVREYLTLPNLDIHLDALRTLGSAINYKLLASALNAILSSDSAPARPIPDNIHTRLWLLAYFIYFHRDIHDGSTQVAPEPNFVRAVTSLLNSLVVYLSQRLEPDDFSESERHQEELIPGFVRDQILSLINQNAVTGLLSVVGSAGFTQGQPTTKLQSVSENAKMLASYALTLLRVFPRRGDDIRMWLYLGSATFAEQPTLQSPLRIPAIKYFWHAVRNTAIFNTIRSDSNQVLPLLKFISAERSEAYMSRTLSPNEREQEWTIILMFLELYTFLLKVMDDEEFFSSDGFSVPTGSSVSWTRESALPLRDVKEMTIFLKNLAFTLYWNAADLDETNVPSSDGNGIRSYFNMSGPATDTAAAFRELDQKNRERGLSGVTGIPLDYFKGLVTGLLRMIHERDSRRKFLPDGHWLMTSQFDMEGFIPAVVAEEEKRHQIQDDEDEDDQDPPDDLAPAPFLGLVGTSRTQQTRRIENLRRRQKQAARRKQLEAVAPRLEILRNMPFFIPFATRVQIFREFIYRDQISRRHGFTDPDAWRMSVAQRTLGRFLEGGFATQDILNRHHANIRRDNVFDDAFDQFYELGDGLKEPIQISFIDKFGAVEAGIDGGGVTKEFLTSVTMEAFKSSDGLNLFIENDQNLLYPNPVALDQRREQLRQLGFLEGKAEWNEQIRDLLRRYKFLGRVIGKCLYEGILVDVHFAGFFLLKWALTGGTGSAQKESAYRANLNDLRDLDEELYQGLLQLKNYPGDVEDFALNFTVTDTTPIPGHTAKNTTRDLKLGGSNIPVTNQNRLVYISYIARHRLQVQPYYQTNAFLQGLGQIIQPSWLSMFNQNELQTLIGGDASDIDVADLRRNTLYGGVYVIGDDKLEHPTIKFFWEVLEGMTNEERQKVLKFVTSTPRAPLLGFSHLNPRFSIRDSSDDQDRLPSTSTCVNLLKLPRYTNARTLREKLLYAINSGAGFDLS